MSGENVETARRAIEAGNRMDVDGIMAEYRDDAELLMPLEGPSPGKHEGHQAIRRFFEDFYGQWTKLVIDVDEMIDLDDRVVCVVDWRATGRGGIEVSQSGAFIYDFDAGKISRVSFFGDRATALEAVGLRDR